MSKGWSAPVAENRVRPLNRVEQRLLKYKISAQQRSIRRYRGRSLKAAVVLWCGGSALSILAGSMREDWDISGSFIVFAIWVGLAGPIPLWSFLEDRSQRR